MITVLDYDAGNIKSVEKALNFLGEEVKITRDREEILSADGVILPGVGAFGDAMEKLHQYGLVDVIHEVVDRQIPFLGICLGLQLMFESSEETPGVEGLHLLDGKIRRIPAAEELKIPHIGWNDLTFPNEGRLFRGVEEHSYVYFVHSYYLEAADPSIVTATTEYGTLIHASVEKGNIFARKKYTHTIGVTCNGESYDVTSTRILMRFLSSGGPYIKSSKIIDEGLARNGEQYSSWLKVEQSWSTGEVKTETYSVDLTSFARGKEAVSRVIPDTNLQRLSSEMNEISSENVYSPCDYVDVVRYTKEYIVHYNYFDVGYDIMQDVPVYDDGITYHVMPALDFGEVEEKMWFEGGEETTYQGKPCYLWDYYHQISIVFGDIKQSAYVSFSAFVMK